MGKLILHECTFNSINGKDPDMNTLEYSAVVTGLTITCICADGTIAGGYITANPFSLWYVTSNVASLITGKKVTKICLMGAQVWLDAVQLQQLADGEFYQTDGGGNAALEKQYLDQLIADGGGQYSLEAVVNEILNFIPAYIFRLNDKETNITFYGKENSVVVDQMVIPYIS